MWSSLARSARRLAPVCAVSAVSALALAAPGVANAVTRLPHCSEGTEINGEGSTLQELAQKDVWTGGYKTFCPGAGAVTYNEHGKTGSGPGMENWYALDEFGPVRNGFVGTDNPPTKAIEEKILEQGTAGAEVLTIPTLQAAVSFIIHLPKGCTAESEVAPGKIVHRVVLTEKDIENIYRRKLTKWSKLTTGKLGKAPALNHYVTTTECSKKVQESEITRVARLEGSGTTATFKKWLELVNGKAEKTVNGKTWLESGEEPPANTEWPEETKNLIRGKGSGGMAKEVETNPGTIAYDNFANVRTGKFIPSGGGGEGSETFWAEVENGQTEKVEGKAYKVYAEPSTNGISNEKADSNCEETEYVTIDAATGKPEKGKFPPPSTKDLWNTVSDEKKEKKYPLCGFTYDLALTKYSDFASHGATEGEATAVGDYLEYVLGTGAGEGQSLIAEKEDYLGLPTNKTATKNVLKIAQEGAKEISD
jgi:ABC-type phosphate transport system substrate-binding protein